MEQIRSGRLTAARHKSALLRREATRPRGRCGQPNIGRFGEIIASSSQRLGCFIRSPSRGFVVRPVLWALLLVSGTSTVLAHSACAVVRPIALLAHHLTTASASIHIQYIGCTSGPTHGCAEDDSPPDPASPASEPSIPGFITRPKPHSRLGPRPSIRARDSQEPATEAIVTVIAPYCRTHTRPYSTPERVRPRRAR